MVCREIHSSHGDGFHAAFSHVTHHVFSAPTEESKTRAGLPQPGVMPGRENHFRMNYSEKTWNLFISGFFPLPANVFHPRSRSTPPNALPHPHIHIILLCISKEITSFRSPKALLDSFCIYIVHYSGSWVEKRALSCVFVLAIVYAGLTNEGTVGIISISDVNIKLLI